MVEPIMTMKFLAAIVPYAADHTVVSQILANVRMFL